MTSQHGDFTLSDDPALIDFDRVHPWLASSYWSPGVSRELVEKAFSRSDLVLGAYLDGLQVGVLRVISDGTTFGWICDVWVDETARKRGLAKALVRFALEHPDFKGLRRWTLATRDAHEVYEACGFHLLDMPGKWMIYKPHGEVWPPQGM